MTRMGLEEDDLDLLEENTGDSLSRDKLRLRDSDVCVEPVILSCLPDRPHPNENKFGLLSFR